LFSPFAAWFPGGATIFQPYIRCPLARFLTNWILQTFLHTKNSLWDELNVLKRKLNVKTKQGIDDYRLKTSMVGQNVCLWTSGSNLLGG
jgi:hypothetical protein